MQDGVARLIVEIAKREWPQQWPGMLNKLSNICAAGSKTQEELILLFFLRLAEDTAVLQVQTSLLEIAVGTHKWKFRIGNQRVDIY